MKLWKGKLCILLILFNIFEEVTTWDKFCSVICANKQCTSTAYAACTQCMLPWTWNATINACELLPSTGWVVVDRSTDISGSITSDLTTTATCGPCSGGSGGCSGGSQWQYSYTGNLTGNGVITFTDSTGPQVPHYQLRVIFWMILIDNWQDQNQIRVRLNGSQLQTMVRNNRLSSEKVCGNNGNQEDYLRFDKTYTHNTSTSYNFSITTNNSGSRWGVKQFVVLARLCHEACTACFGAAVSQCTACQQNTPMWLSGTTCNETCLPGYGQTSDMMTCVFCDLKCTVCYQVSYNCTACKTSGTYASFLLAANYSCQTTCPVGMYANYTDRNCYFCDPSCTTCRTTPTYCFGCNTTLGYAWNGYTCYNPCPVGTFLSNNDTNCTNCSLFCISCVNTSTTCAACTLTGMYTAYLLGTDCLRACPNEFYADTANGTLNTCQRCDMSCFVCTADPSPCSACNPGWWLMDSACGNTCPTDYFADNTTWSCLLCEIWCVKLTMQMYFPDATNSMIYVDMKFSQDLDFTTFPYQTFQTFTIDSDLYTLSMFNFTYQIINPRFYRIIMQPKGYIFLYNATIHCKTMDLPSIVHDSQNGRPFRITNYEIQRQLVWFVIKAPDMTQIQKAIINGFSEMSGVIRDITTQPYIQQIKKSGLFAFLFSGAQITSCSVLINNIPSQNMYQGVRFWAIFVFFDVPPWQRNSDKTKYVVVPSVNQVVNNSRLLQQHRMLFDIYSIQWRFTRTGHTSFFIFDTYPVLVLILVCWLLVVIGYCVNKRKPLLFKTHMDKFYTLIHKVHQISIMYIMLSTIMQWLYFDNNSLERWLSFGFCLIFNIYFFIYELYIYYDMLKYPVAEIGNPKYQYYAIRYGSLLKNIRYIQYDLKESWSPKQWFRPYNYHILSFYKKLMMIVSLPLFYHTTHAQAGVLTLLQALQIARFCFVWPFYRKWRNIYRLVLECALQMFFISVLIQGFLVQQIMINNQATLEYSIQMFYRFGWVSFGMVFFFNIGFIILYIFDFVRGCRMTNQQMMDEARKVYYYDKLKAYEEENVDVPLGLVNKWVKKGNLNDRNYDVLPDVNIRIEYYRIAKLSNGAFEIQAKRLIDLYMSIQFNFSKDNNVSCGHKINKRFTLNRKNSKQFYYLIDSLFKKYDKHDIEYITIKTFQHVEQSLYKPGDKVELIKEKMTQKIILQFHSGERKTETFNHIMDGFPISVGDLTTIS